jgi:hypothetical protein
MFSVIGPRHENVAIFETEVPVETGGVIFVADEAGHGGHWLTII